MRQGTDGDGVANLGAYISTFAIVGHVKAGIRPPMLLQIPPDATPLLSIEIRVQQQIGIAEVQEIHGQALGRH